MLATIYEEFRKLIEGKETLVFLGVFVILATAVTINKVSRKRGR